MATIRTFSQIAQALIDDIRLRRPALTTNPGSITRDVFIDPPADQIAIIYRDLGLIQRTQSLLSATGITLDQFGSNYGITRDTGKRATGNAILTFNNLLNNININSGTTVTAKTGVVFRITANIIISAATKGVYSSFATSIAAQLHIAGISDQYAVQVPIEATNIGANGIIPTFSLIKTSISGITNVTNIAPTTGGTNPQGDPQYRNQILAGLSGSAAGTSRGYKNALLAVSGIKSVFVAVPGNPILTRDGTITSRSSDGSLVVLNPGTGGKVDIWIHGSDFINITESYVFHDVSGTGDPSNLLNTHIFGQITNTANLTPIERREIFTQNGQLPQQPVDSIISVSGSISGANFIRGINYELVKDTNQATLNTAFALDKLVFLQDFISIVGENVAKGNTNGIDNLVFKNVKSINNIHQSIIITNDLATLNLNDHTQITISHRPLDTLLRATNLTTGERYIITNQNINTATGVNDAGVVSIDGSVLPSPQDLVQVDYTWDFAYDSNIDYFSLGSSPFVKNAVDWGKSNHIVLDPGLLIRNGNRYNINVSRNIDRVFSVFYCDTQTTTVQRANLVDQSGTLKALRQITISTGLGPAIYFSAPGINLIASGIVVGSKVHITLDSALISRNGIYTITRIVDQTVFQVQPTTPGLAIESGNALLEIRTSNDITILIPMVTIINLTTTAENVVSVTNVISVISQLTGIELFSTDNAGTFSGNIVYLATDVVQPDIGESVLVYFDSQEIYNIAKNNGTTSTNSIILGTDDVLSFNSILQPINDIFNGISVKAIFAEYISVNIDLVTRTPIILMPFVGASSISILVDKNGSTLTSQQLIEFDSNSNITRFGPAYLSFIVDGAFSSGGTFAIKGTGWFKISAAINISQTNINGVFDLSTTITNQLGTISNNYSVARIAQASINTQSLLIRGYSLNNKTYDADIAITSASLNSTSVDFGPILAQNKLASLTVGATFNIVFYVIATNIAETIQFTTGRGILYTRFKYARVDRVDLISGFTNPSTSVIAGNLRIGKVSQPSTGSTYLADYSYFGPVENENITTVYKFNNLIQDATNAIENVRTLTADVLTRLSLQIAVNVSATVILTIQAINQSSQVIDQAISAVNNLITSIPDGGILDYSAILRVITTITGVDGADVTILDFVGSEFNGTANRKSLTADANQYFSVGQINIISGTR